MGHKLLYLALNVFLLYQSSLQESCDRALGLEDGTISDARISASSEINDWHGKNNVRLNRHNNRAWCSKTNSVGEYIQVDLGAAYAVTGVATKGKNGTWPLYVTSYYIAYGFDGKTFHEYTDEQGTKLTFPGNDGKHLVQSNSLPRPVVGRFIRIYPNSWRRKVCMQMELYGCAAKNCSLNNGDCSEKCTQVNDFEVRCGCHKKGYKLVDGVCEDIDECKERNPCDQHNCTNTDGSFKCTCNEGYRLGSNGVSCHDINECLGNHTCHQKCRNTRGSYRCECRSGFEFGDDGKTCIDIDECARNISGCDHNCHNTIGSFKCSCRSGYYLTGYYKKSCRDVNECQGNNKCTQICINNEGSYTCRCRNGFVLSKNGFGCDDIDECKLNTSGCSHKCVNNIGSFSCVCPKGYRLQFNGRICEDVDECRYDNGKCQNTCHNSEGSYSCSCFEGYKLKSDQHSCEDINECIEKNDCDLSSTLCTNTEPFHRCDCKKGFQPKKGSSTSCERVKCSALPISSKYTVSPPRCQSSDVNLFEQNCTYSCARGYEPVNPSAMVVTCLSNRQWSSGPPQCKGIRCPSIHNPTNGRVNPPECNTGIQYPGHCSIRCNSGFLNTGPSTVKCESDGKFSISDLSTLGCKKDAITPSISCPPGITAVLPKGASSMIVSDKWKDAYTNVGTIKSSHDENHLFPVGITTVTFTATTKDGLSDSCSIRVTVSDKEAPSIVYCPTTQYVRVNSTHKMVQWPEPQFRDNVGVVSAEPNVRFGKLSPSTHPVVYKAKDAAGNSAKCSFDVIVTERVCSEDDFIVGSGTTKSCSGFPGFGTYCAATCHPGKIFLQQPESWYTCTTDGIWEPKDKLPVPECVGYTAFTGECPKGTFEKLQNTGTKICANCPAGTYFEAGKCVVCPVGFYQDQEKQLSCSKCPDNQGTEKTGAKKCKRLCGPGTYSASGFPGENQPCSLCPVGSYQPSHGKKSCIQCPKDTSTLSVGRMLASDCGRVGEITLTPSAKATVVEGNDVIFSCKSSALPWLTVQWKKTNPLPDGIGGKVTVTDILEKGRLVGKKFKITKPIYHDRGVYMCETKNQFGVARKSLSLDVLRNLPA